MEMTDRNDDLEVERVFRLLGVQYTVELSWGQLLAVLLKEPLWNRERQMGKEPFPW